MNIIRWLAIIWTVILLWICMVAMLKDEKLSMRVAGYISAIFQALVLYTLMAQS